MLLTVAAMLMLTTLLLALQAYKIATMSEEDRADYYQNKGVPLSHEHH